MSKIRKELEEEVNVRQADDEKYETYLTRLWEMCDDFYGNCEDDDPKWVALSEGARKWLDDGIDALDNNLPVPDFPKESEGRKLRRDRKKDGVVNEKEIKDVQEFEPKKDKNGVEFPNDVGEPIKAEDCKVDECYYLRVLDKKGKTIYIKVDCFRQAPRNSVFRDESNSHRLQPTDFVYTIDSNKSPVKKDKPHYMKASESIEQEEEIKKDKPKSVTTRITEITCLNQDLSFSEVIVKLQDEGFNRKSETLKQYYNKVQFILSILRENNLLVGSGR